MGVDYSYDVDGAGTRTGDLCIFTIPGDDDERSRLDEGTESYAE